MNRYPLGLLTLVLLTGLLMGGCWDSVPIDEMGIVLAIGIDLGDEPDTFSVAFEIVKPTGLGGNQEAGQGVPQQSIIVTGDGRTIMEAMQSVQRRVSRRLFLSQLQLVIFGQDLARQGLVATVDHLQRSGELRRTMSIIVSEQSAYEALQAVPQLLAIRGLSFDALTFQANKTGYFDVIFGDFLERITSRGASAVAPAVQRTPDGTGLRVSGMAAFNDDRVVGIFNHPESLGLALVLNRAQPQTVIVGESAEPDSKFFTSFSLQSLSSTIEPKIVNGKIEATMTVEVQSLLLEQTGGGNLTTSKNWSVLETMQEEAVKNAVHAIIKRSQEWHVDPFELGNIIERRFPKEWKTIEKVWPESIADVQFNVKIHSRVTETGLLKGTTSLPGRNNT